MPLQFDNEHDITLDYRVGEDINNVTPDSVILTTKYLLVEVRPEQSVDGQMETWTRITTRPAFEIAFLRKEGERIFVVLMKKRRRAGDPPIMKLPGGYFRDDDDINAYAQKKVLHDTGIHFNPSTWVPLGGVIGHAEIHTPIWLGYTADWQFKDKPRPGVEVIKTPFEDAVELAIAGKIENDSSFSALMRLFYLQQKGLLKI